MEQSIELSIAYIYNYFSMDIFIKIHLQQTKIIFSRPVNL